MGILMRARSVTLEIRPSRLRPFCITNGGIKREIIKDNKYESISYHNTTEEEAKWNENAGHVIAIIFSTQKSPNDIQETLS